MILRRMIEHVKAQNWTAVGLDFVIVVLGVFIGLQVQQFTVERDRRNSERQYLHRLHEEVRQLIEARALYDASRAQFSAELFGIAKTLEDDAATARLTPLQCRTIAHSSFTTIPPAGLPTVTELLSAGRLDQLSSQKIRDSVLAYIQEADRARDFITGISNENQDLARRYPDLIDIEVVETALYSDSVGLTAVCDDAAMRNDAGFMNDLTANTYDYVHYAERGVLSVSQRLKSLHEVIDGELGVTHADAKAEQ